MGALGARRVVVDGEGERDLEDGPDGGVGPRSRRPPCARLRQRISVETSPRAGSARAREAAARRQLRCSSHRAGGRWATATARAAASRSWAKPATGTASSSTRTSGKAPVRCRGRAPRSRRPPPWLQAPQGVVERHERLRARALGDRGHRGAEVPQRRGDVRAGGRGLQALAAQGEVQRRVEVARSAAVRALRDAAGRRGDDMESAERTWAFVRGRRAWFRASARSEGSPGAVSPLGPTRGPRSAARRGWIVGAPPAGRELFRRAVTPSPRPKPGVPARPSDPCAELSTHAHRRRRQGGVLTNARSARGATSGTSAR